MTDYREYNDMKGWILPNNQSHNYDYRVVAVVQLLARQAAREDYDDLLVNTRTQKPARDHKDTIQ